MLTGETMREAWASVKAQLILCKTETGQQHWPGEFSQVLMCQCLFPLISPTQSPHVKSQRQGSVPQRTRLGSPKRTGNLHVHLHSVCIPVKGGINLQLLGSVPGTVALPRPDKCVVAERRVGEGVTIGNGLHMMIIMRNICSALYSAHTPSHTSNYLTLKQH